MLLGIYYARQREGRSDDYRSSRNVDEMQVNIHEATFHMFHLIMANQSITELLQGIAYKSVNVCTSLEP